MHLGPKALDRVGVRQLDVRIGPAELGNDFLVLFSPKKIGGTLAELLVCQHGHDFLLGRDGEMLQRIVSPVGTVQISATQSISSRKSFRGSRASTVVRAGHPDWSEPKNSL